MVHVNFAKKLLVMLLFSIPMTAQAIVHSLNDEDSKRWAKKISPSIGFLQVSFEDETAQEGSAVLISPSVILTAAHLVGAGLKSIKVGIVNFNSDGKNVDVGPLGLISVRDDARVVIHPESDCDASGVCRGVDLAIIKLNKPLANPSPAILFEGDLSNWARSTAYIVGYGCSGTPETGPTIQDKTRRWAISQPELEVETGKFEFSYQPFPHFATFERRVGIPFLGVGASGDSGGPLFFNKGKGTTNIVAGIYHGGEMLVYSNGDRVVKDQWLGITPERLEWLKSQVSRVAREEIKTERF